MLSVRGSMRPAAPDSAYGSSRQPPAAISAASAAARRPGREVRAERVEQRLRRGRRVADHPDVDRPVRADRGGIEVDLRDAGVRPEQRRRAASSTG